LVLSLVGGRGSLLHGFNLEKAVSRQARKERKGKPGKYWTQAIHLIGLGLYLHMHLNFFATFAPLRE
jgi:hypothetical protein